MNASTTSTRSTTTSKLYTKQQLQSWFIANTSAIDLRFVQLRGTLCNRQQRFPVDAWVPATKEHTQFSYIKLGRQAQPFTLAITLITLGVWPGSRDPQNFKTTWRKYAPCHKRLLVLDCVSTA